MAVGLIRSAGPRVKYAVDLSAWNVPIVIFAFTRCLALLVGWQAPHILPQSRGRQSSPVLPADQLAVLGHWAATWFRYDTGWYVGIATGGYHWGGLDHANTNFMPLYPSLIWLAKPLLLGNAWIASWLVANLACLAAFVMLWRWALRRWDRETATRSLFLMAIFPFGYFYFAPYAEPVFLALAVAALLFAEQQRWGPALVFAGLACVTRPVGLAVVVAVASLAISRRDWRHAAFSLASVMPLAAFGAYLGFRFGHPLGFLTYHSGGWVGPRRDLMTTVVSQFHTHLAPFDRVDAFLALLFLASVPLVWRRIGSAYGLYVAVGVLLPLAHGLVSMERYVIVLFPGIMAGATLGGRVVQTSIFALSLSGFILFTAMFTSGYAVF